MVTKAVLVAAGLVVVRKQEHEVGNDFPGARARFWIVQTCWSTNGTVVVEVEVEVTMLVYLIRLVSNSVVVRKSTVVVLSVKTVVSILVDVAVTVIVGRVVGLPVLVMVL